MKKVMSIVLTALLSTSVLSACGNKNENVNINGGNNAGTENSKDNGTSESTGKSVFRMTGGKTATLNNQMYQSGSEGTVMKNIYGSMLRYVANEAGDSYEVVPYHAKDFPTSNETGDVWVFELKDGITFSDGEPIDAEAYAYSYKMLLDPVLKNYRASMLFRDVDVKNARNYYEGNCTWEEVGIKVLEGNKLELTLERPVTKFDFEALFAESGGTSPINPKLYESCFNADRTENSYGTSLETTTSSGPYVLTEWVRDQSKVYAKNENAALAELYTVDEIQERVVEDESTKLTLFENGDIDYVEVTGANYDKYAEDPRLKFARTPGVQTMFINMESETNPILGDLNFRNALFWGLNRDVVAEEIIKVGLPAAYFIPDFRYVEPGVTYRDTEGAQALVPENNGYDADKALEYFNKAYEANGNKKVIVEMKYNDQLETMKKMCEYMETEYEALFGADKIDIQLKAVPKQSVTEDMKSGAYDVSFAGWSGWYFHPWAGMEVHTSDYSGKLDRLRNAEFDELFNRTVKGDLIFEQEKKLEALVRMEEILYEEMPFVPLYQNRKAALFSDRVELHTSDYFPIIEFAPLQAKIAPLE